MFKAVLQNRMASDVLTAAQGRTCVIIKIECCVFIPDHDKNVTELLTDNTHQMGALIDSTLSLNDWLGGGP